MDDRGKSAPEPPTLNTTRQMLDELEALMERMLAVPTIDTDESAHPKSRPLAPTLTLLQVPPEEPSTAGDLAENPPLDPPHAGSNPSHLGILSGVDKDIRQDSETSPTPKVLSFSYRTPELPPLAGPVAPREAFSTRALPPTSQPSVDALLDEVPAPIVSPVDWAILPIIWCNRLFDRGTMLLGEPGSWLRTPLGRTAVGTLGLIMLGAARCWMAREWFGWRW